MQGTPSHVVVNSNIDCASKDVIGVVSTNSVTCLQVSPGHCDPHPSLFINPHLPAKARVHHGSPQRAVLPPLYALGLGIFLTLE